MIGRARACEGAYLQHVLPAVADDAIVLRGRHSQLAILKGREAHGIALELRAEACGEGRGQSRRTRHRSMMTHRLGSLSDMWTSNRRMHFTCCRRVLVLQPAANAHEHTCNQNAAGEVLQRAVAHPAWLSRAPAPPDRDTRSRSAFVIAAVLPRANSAAGAAWAATEVLK